MTLQQICYFLALCDEQNFTQAALRCGVSQPSLTSAIKALETELGGSLFLRDRKTTSLSPLGIIIRPHFAAIDRSAADAMREATEFVNPGRYKLFKARPPSSITPTEAPMRKVAFSAAITAAIIIFAVVLVRPYPPATASPPTPTSGIVDIYKLQSTIDIKALPRHDGLSEADE